MAVLSGGEPGESFPALDRLEFVEKTIGPDSIGNLRMSHGEDPGREQEQKVLRGSVGAPMSEQTQGTSHWPFQN